MEIFNKEDIYDEQISPLVQQLIDICQAHEIPMIASFTYENSPERGPGRCTTLLNHFSERLDDANAKAVNIIKRGGQETFSMAITTTTTPN